MAISTGFSMVYRTVPWQVSHPAVQLWLGSMDLDAADAARWQLRKSSNFQGLTLSNYSNSNYVFNNILYYIIWL